MNRQTKKHVLGLKRLSLVVSAMLYVGTVFANNPLVVDLPAQSLGESLHHLAKQSGAQILFSNEITGKQQVKSVKGQLTVEQALQQLLQGTGLAIKDNGNNSFSIVPAAQQQSRDMGQLKPIGVNAIGTANRDSNVAQLPVITVNAENENSYTMRSTSAATGLDLSLRETPQSVTVITKQRMEDQGLNSVGDVLANTTGIFYQESVPVFGETYVYSRGYALTNYQIDGGLAAAYAFGTGSNPFFDTAIYDSMTVVRGATGLLTGAGEPSGSINLNRKRPTQDFQASVETSAGSWDHYRGMFDVSGALNQSGTVRGRAVIATDTSDAWFDNYSGKRSLGYGILDVDLTDHTLLTVTGEYVKEKTEGGDNWVYGYPVVYYDNGEPTNYGKGANMSYDGYSNKTRQTYGLAIDHQFNDNWKLKFNYTYSEWDTDSLHGYVWYMSSDDTATFARVFRNKQKGESNAFDLKLDGHYYLWGRQHDVVLGVNSSDANFDFPLDLRVNGYYGATAHYANGHIVYTPDWSSATNSSANDKKINQRGGYISTRIRPLEHLAVILGARLSDWEYNRKNLNGPINGTLTEHRKYSDEFTPYVGVVYDFNQNLAAYASYTTIFNPQTYYDVNGLVLDPEEGVNYELGLKGEWFNGRLNASMAVFQSNKDNVAVKDDSNLTPWGEQAYRAEDDTKGKGYEMEVAGELMLGWHMQAGFTYVKIKDSDGELLTPDLPVKQFKLFTTYQIPQLPQLTIGGGVNWQSKTVSSEATEKYYDLFKQDAYAVVDLMARYEFNSHLSVAFNLKNAFDKEYRKGLLSRWEYGPERNWMATVKYKF
ncbi:ferripyoverdine/pyocin S3 receptor FpvA [Acinetobacter puyangensis]|uniref:Outer-membrane receptor for ferric coprogen and ferric-rhodotorulic acid n=1 Tax=Acinetobacter puyangensis TaxID=1096779 RepID=A0A240E4I4_9GAMM|nr:TonB-dependent receptor [Acinetobacter puyangensis]SNX43667.1 outer-membrane receptor for ferric coprogen and ferric-rhodotorulic acid [Acinetobacter puyangensis]